MYRAVMTNPMHPDNKQYGFYCWKIDVRALLELIDNHQVEHSLMLGRLLFEDDQRFQLSDVPPCSDKERLALIVPTERYGFDMLLGLMLWSFVHNLDEYDMPKSSVVVLAARPFREVYITTEDGELIAF